MNYDVKCQLLVIGDSTVGKTSILSRFANGTFNANYLATIGLDNFTKDENIDNKNVRIKIWDTAGQERYKALTKGFFRNAQGIMIVYDVTNQETFENLKYWIQTIKTHMGNEIDNIPIIIIGNKIDSEEREVQFEEAESFCKQEEYPYFETSAKTGENIDNTLRFLVKKVIDLNSDNNKGGNNDNNIQINKDENKKKDKSECAC